MFGIIHSRLMSQPVNGSPSIVVAEPLEHSSGVIVKNPVDQCDTSIFPDRDLFTLENQLNAGVSLRDTHVNIGSDIGVDEFLDKVVDNYYEQRGTTLQAQK